MVAYVKDMTAKKSSVWLMWGCQKIYSSCVCMCVYFVCLFVRFLNILQLCISDT